MDMHSQETDELSLKELIQKVGEVMAYLKTQWWKLVLLGLLGGVVGFFYAKSQKPKYTAKLTFALAEGGDKMGGIGSIASQFGVDLMGGGSAGAFSGDNLLELMKSRLLVEKTLLTAVDSGGKSKLLVNQYIDFKKPKKSKPRKSEDPMPVHFTGNEEKQGYSLAQDSFLAKVSADLTKTNLQVAKMDKKLAIVSVSFTGEDQWFAKNFTQILTQNVTEFYVETKTGQMRKNVKMMEHKVDSVKLALGRAMYGVASEVDGNQFLVRGVAKVPQAKKQLEIQVLSTMYGELIKNLELSRTMMAKDQPLIQLIDQPRFPLEKKKASKLLFSVGGSVLTFFLAVIYLLLSRWWKIQNLTS
ncbi:MAG: hypothetical protein RL607_2556 [Bacteroidota bacterium]|jgi:hypothetical protein